MRTPAGLLAIWSEHPSAQSDLRALLLRPKQHPRCWLGVGRQRRLHDARRPEVAAPDPGRAWRRNRLLARSARRGDYGTRCVRHATRRERATGRDRRCAGRSLGRAGARPAPLVERRRPALRGRARARSRGRGVWASPTSPPTGRATCATKIATSKLAPPIAIAWWSPRTANGVPSERRRLWFPGQRPSRSNRCGRIRRTGA